MFSTSTIGIASRPEGGPELSLGWYGIDSAFHLMEDKVKTVYAQYGNFTSPDSPFMDCGRIEMRMAQGGWHRLICIFATVLPIRPGN